MRITDNEACGSKPFQGYQSDVPSNFPASEFSDMLNENMGDESNMSAPGPSNIDRGYDEEAEAARALESDFPKDDEVSQNTAYHERLAELDRDMIRLNVGFISCHPYREILIETESDY